MSCYRLYHTYFRSHYRSIKFFEIVSFTVHTHSLLNPRFSLKRILVDAWGGGVRRMMIQDGMMQFLHACARRLYRIFIHAYEHHNDTFRSFEVPYLCPTSSQKVLW